MSLSFQGGTLVLYDVSQNSPVPPCFQWIKGRWRCEAYHYPALLGWLKQQGIRDKIPQWERLKLTLHDTREPHDYQIAALDAWEKNQSRGSIVLPTGAGKTFVAIHAIYRTKRSALIVAPTIDLLHQWYTRLTNAFETDIGVYYGGEKIIQPITVTTYHSAGDLIAAYGNQFKLVIYDEVHHLPAPAWGETALMSPAPFRLGLTATYPEAHEQSGSRWSVEQLVGPIVYQQRIDDLVGEQLAIYRTERIRVELTDEERAQYDADYAIYADYFRSHNLPRTHGPNWYRELMRQSAFDRDARRALLARNRIVNLLAGSQQKLLALEKLLREYSHEQVLIFTENNDVVYKIACRYLIPALTHETKAAERKHILEGFQNGMYKAIATSRVLNEGVDVPEAKVAIVLGGTSSAREYIQRLGRVLRKSGNRQAVLFEIIVRHTVDEGRARRRRPKPAYVNG
ncbi:MAG TPA: DEAD/DEAH box helicase family protein [Spirillospora sp.]|nr:DEAD/DEAH box helicase family protein [Spirillospora sp.]